MKAQIAADATLASIVKRYQDKAPKLATWMETNLQEGLTVFMLSPAHRRLMRTNNSLERVNKEIRRRTRVVGVFPNDASCLCLVSAVLMEISDDWEAEESYHFRRRKILDKN
jgi:transposase-like protein